MFRSHVLICGGAGCLSTGCKAVLAQFLAELKAHKLEEEVKVVETGCIGTCDLGPVIVVYPEGVFYQKVKVDDVKEIVEEHLLKGRYVTRLLYERPVTGEQIPLMAYEFSGGKVDRFAECWFNQSMMKVSRWPFCPRQSLTEYTPEQTELKASGVGGRRWVPDRLKWEFTEMPRRPSM